MSMQFDLQIKEMANRIKMLMEQKMISKTAFAESIGITGAQLSHIYSGRNNVSLAIAMQVLNAYPEVNIEWLLYGKGQMSRLNNLNDKQGFVSEDKIQGEINFENLDSNSEISNFSPQTDFGLNQPENLKTDEIQTLKQQIEVLSQKLELAEAKICQRRIKRVIVYYDDNSFDEFEN